MANTITKTTTVFKIDNSIANQIVISASNINTNLDVFLYDISGREIQKWQNIDFVPNETKNLMIQNSSIKGLYFLKIQGENVNYTTKILQTN